MFRQNRVGLWIVAGVACLTVAGLALGDDEERVRPAYCAGNWYPGDAAALAKAVEEALGRAGQPQSSGKPRAIIAPHAGYRFSAPAAAAAYTHLRGHDYKRVIILALSHRGAGSYRGVDVPEGLAAYATPLGKVPLDQEVCTSLREHALFAAHPGLDAGEHSLELQLPYLQRVLKEFKLVPLLVGEMSPVEHAQAARALLPYLDADALLVASSDFTHFGPNYGYQPFTENVPDRLRELAEQAAAPLLRCDYDGFAAHLAKTRDTICGRGPLALLLRLLSMQGGAAGERTAYDTSGQMLGDWRNSVTYQSFVFTARPGTLTAAERATLLRIARETVTAFLNGQPTPQVDSAQLAPGPSQDGACFVTLENHGELRGCIGNMIADGPLYQAVISNAVSACQDRRFVDNPVTAGELDELHIEISYLTPMKKVLSAEKIVVGQHGLLITLGSRRGVLLPQVAYERGWTRAVFLEQTCRKAGLPGDAWRRPEAEIYSFEAEVFGEPE